MDIQGCVLKNNSSDGVHPEGNCKVVSTHMSRGNLVFILPMTFDMPRDLVILCYDPEKINDRQT